MLGGSSDEKEEKGTDDDDDNKNPRNVRGGGGGGSYHDHNHGVSKKSNNCLVQMDGPALTVIEGTVTKGVDLLLGLDVLQDWEAEIRMGGPIKTITVREKRKSTTMMNRRSEYAVDGDEIADTVVVPFATSTNNRSSRRCSSISAHGVKRYTPVLLPLVNGPMAGAPSKGIWRRQQSSNNDRRRCWMMTY